MNTTATLNDIIPDSPVMQDTTRVDDVKAVLDSIEGTVGDTRVENPKMEMRGVDVSYGEKQAIYDVDLDVARNEVIAMIGPSGCGKSTFLRCMNRMNDTLSLIHI